MHIRSLYLSRVLIAGSPSGSTGAFHFGTYTHRSPLFPPLYSLTTYKARIPLRGSMSSGSPHSSTISRGTYRPRIRISRVPPYAFTCVCVFVCVSMCNHTTLVCALSMYVRARTRNLYYMYLPVYVYVYMKTHVYRKLWNAARIHKSDAALQAATHITSYNGHE